ncbi:hypothetical protein yc1106_02167 [Curvularia clavata]|uniref:Uncharacterized protein n=1 Tax=Curvularia clavata TaxID=95742 RepID=A0A9Q8Z5W5_CURCL|nr:hypothetical protein yc1106_02167 [Curvularia clavata]
MSYVPTDEPFKSRTDSREWQQYEQAIKDHGPLLPNYTIQVSKISETKQGNTRGNYYFETARSKEKEPGSWNHPCSPTEAHLRPTFDDEYVDDRKSVTGIFHPPMLTYKAGSLVFHYHDTWEAALAASLNASGVDHKGKAVSTDIVKAMNAEMNKAHLDMIGFRHNRDTGVGGVVFAWRMGKLRW